MKKILSALLVAAMICTLAISASAVEWSYDAAEDKLIGNMTIYKGTPTVDGVMDDIYKLADTVECLPENEWTWATGLISDPGCGATNYLLWDENYLYIFGECIDNTPLVVNDDFDMWCHDGFEWAFKAPNGEYSGQTFFRLRAAGTLKNSEGDILNTEDAGIIYIATPTDAGWNYEIAIPLPNLSVGMLYDVSCCQVIDIYDSLALDIVAKGVQPSPEWIAANSNGKKGYSNLYITLSAEEIGGSNEETEETKADETQADTTAKEDEKVDETVDAPQTFDAGIIAAVAAIVSAAGYAISKKR